MRDKKDNPEGIYALVSGAGTSLVQQDGLVAVILIEKAVTPAAGTSAFKSTIYGRTPAVILLQDKNQRWNVTGPIKEISSDALITLVEGLKQEIARRGDKTDK